jgi:hypothetical protein
VNENGSFGRLFRRRSVSTPRRDTVIACVNPFPTDGLDLLVRDDDGFEMTLFWSPSTERTWIDVHRPDTGVRLMFEAAPARALDAFYDSFAYFFMGLT